MKIKAFIIAFALVTLFAGCLLFPQNRPVAVYIWPPDKEGVGITNPALAMMITNELERSPDYRNFRRRSKRPGVLINALEPENNWIWVELGEESEDGFFFARWDYLKIETNSGTIMILGIGTNDDDKLTVDYQPHK